MSLLSTLAALLLAAAALAPAAAQAADPPLITQFCEHGTAGGRCEAPRSLAADPSSGDVYIADAFNNRIQKFTAWGHLLRAWGWGVVASGPDNQPANAIKEVAVDATGGAFRLSFYGGLSLSETAPIPFDATAAQVQEVFESLSSIEPGDIAVSGPKGGPWTIEFAGHAADKPIIMRVKESTLSGGKATAMVKTVQNGSSFEVCVPASGDICRAGYAIEDPEGSLVPTGSFKPASVALDSAGDVYVADHGIPSSHRVLKFDPEGHFLLTFGGEVNKTKVALREAQEAASEPVTVTEAEENLCTAASGDECGAATKGTGDGQFEEWPFQRATLIAVARNGTPEASDDTVYVADRNRIQEFDSSGEYQDQLSLPEAGQVGALAVDNDPASPNFGDLYFAYASNLSKQASGHVDQPDVYRLDPTTGAVLDTFEATFPIALAAGQKGDAYVLDEKIFTGNDGDPLNHKSRVLQLDATGNQAAKLLEAQFEVPQGLATSSACGIEGTDLLLSGAMTENISETQYAVRLYGPPPTDFEAPCNAPPRVPPAISAQHAASVSTDGATVAARVNPRFWPDTSYYVQYGTGKCSEGGCDHTAQFPGTALEAGVTGQAILTKGVFLGSQEALQPDTTYHYRFVASSEESEAATAYGEDPDGEEGPEEASEAAGLESTLHTFPLPYPAKEDCPNQAYRTAASASLPDCRAYELVSPLDKGHAQVDEPADGHDLSASDGEAVTYTGLGAAFGEPVSSPLFTQLISYREPTGWRTKSIDPPRELPILYRFTESDPLFKAFDENLCSGWLVQDTATPLAPEAPAEVPNVYRDSGLRPGCGEGGYELITTVAPPGFSEESEPGNSFYYLEVQGFSADNSLTVFRAPARLTPDAAEGELRQVYAESEGQLHLVSVLPSGEAVATHASVGTTQGNPGGFRWASVQHAVSSDGQRVFWSDCAPAEGGCTAPRGGGSTGDSSSQLGYFYLRLHPTQPQSPLAHVTGTGRVTKESKLITSLVTAKGKANLTKESSKATLTETSVGQWVAGQPITGTGIPAGATITEVSGSTLTLSAAATATGAGVAVSSKGPAPFVAGQPISGPGIPAKTTIVKAAAGSLTLSAEATESGSATTPLDAIAGCTDPEKACTYPISETEGSRFIDASANGSHALYTIPGEEGGTELHEVDVDALIAGKAEPDTAIAKGVVGVMGSSEDASRVYLASTETCSGEAKNSEGAKAQKGKPNLYLYERGESCAAGQFAFVGTLSGADAEAGTVSHTSPLDFRPSIRSSRVASDGLTAAFASTASLTGYDNLDANSEEPDAEVYLYDAESGKLVCASCNPSGARPQGRHVVAPGTNQPAWTAATLPGWPDQLHASRLLSVDGSRLFFESFDPLVTRDTNGRQDVYEWESASGKAPCEEAIGGELYVPQSEGCLSLISSGEGTEDADLIDASTDGHDVFFTTPASLLPQDPGLIDVYDARVEGGFPSPPSPPAACEGEACQAPPEAPNDPTPASATFEGAGNVREETPPKPRCRKGKIRRHGKCATKHHRKDKRRRSHRNRGAGR